MKKLLQFLSQKWIISIIGMIALVVLIWFGGPYLGIAESKPLASQFNRLLAILILIVAWGLNNFRLRIKATQANDQMIDTLVATPEPPQETETDISAEEVATLKQRFEEATKHLKQTSLKDRLFGKQYLYDLPWYIIIGPPGCGKTTLLENSGLEFPLSRHQDEKKISGIGGTRNCDWWFTDDAVLLDTAGRYTTQDSDAAADSGAWLGFLDLLRKHRPRRPLNGIIVSLSAEELLTNSEQQQELHAQTIRQRVQELYTHLGIELPVYFLVTKVDLVAGFNEFFDDLNIEERAQVWGATFSQSDSRQSRDLGELFASEFDALLEKLNARELWRIYQERDQTRRRLIHGFSQQMAGLIPVLESFIQKTFSPSRFESKPWLRGVYFTSGTQQGSPIDRVMSALAGSFGLSLQALPAYQGRPRSYFINRFFRDILFQEAELAGANIHYERQRLWLQRGAYAGALILTVVIIFAWAASFTRNELRIDKIEASVEHYQQVASKLPTRPGLNDTLQALQAAKEITLVYDTSGQTPWFMGMGLYQGYKLGEAADLAYESVLQQFLIPDIQARLEDEMGKGRRDPEVLRQLLSIYMMLVTPDTLDTKTFRPWVETSWQQQLEQEPEIHNRLLGHLDALLLTELPPQTPNQQLVARVQRVVCEIPLTRQIYARLEQLASANIDDYDFTRLSKQITNIIVSKDDRKTKVPGFYTFSGYHDILEAEGVNTANLTIAENRRICEDKQDELATADSEALLRHVRNQYFDDYVDHWDEFLANIELSSIRNLSNAVETLDTLSGRDSPLESFVKAVSEQTVLERAKLKSILDHFDVTKELSKPSNAVERAYAPLHQLLQGQDDEPAGIDTISTQLRDLYDYTAEIADASDQSEAAFEAAKARMGQGKKDAIRELRSTARKLPKPVAGIVESAATQSWGTILGSARAYINTVWRSSVMREYRASLENRYPIFLKGRQQTALADFGNFFGESGTIDNFTKTYLAPFIDTRRWRLRVVDERSLGLSNAALSQLKRATLIREMFFQDGGNQVSVGFTLKPIYLDASVKRFMLEVAGERLTYKHDPPRTSPIEWPGQNDNNRARITFERIGAGSFSDTENGPWAWFKLLDGSDIERRSNDQVLINFTTSGLKATYQLQASSVTNPFSSSEFTRFRCPERL